MTVIWENIELFVLVLARISAFIFLLPILGNRTVPLPAKIGVSVFLSIFMVTVMHELKTDVIPETLPFVVAVIKEVLVGLTLGFITRFIFTGVQIAGEMIGMQMGFGVAKVMDPQFQAQMSIISEFQIFIVYLIYLAINGHHFLLKGFLQSFQAIPLGRAIAGQGFDMHVVQMGSNMFLSGIKIGAPVIVALLLTNIALGILARTVPQMNVFIVGLPLKIGIGILGLSMTIVLFQHVFTRIWEQFQRDFIVFIRLF